MNEGQPIIGRRKFAPPSGVADFYLIRLVRLKTLSFIRGTQVGRRRIEHQIEEFTMKQLSNHRSPPLTVWHHVALGLAMALSFLACSNRAKCETVYLYGALNSTDGMTMIRPANGQPSEIAKANELRPAVVEKDWSRMLIALVPLSTDGEYVDYYVSADMTLVSSP